MPDTRPHRDGQRCAHCGGGRGNRMPATPAGCMPAVVRNVGEREYAEERGLAPAWDELPRAPRVNRR
jgi:hypothetical protein